MSRPTMKRIYTPDYKNLTPMKKVNGPVKGPTKPALVPIEIVKECLMEPNHGRIFEVIEVDRRYGKAVYSDPVELTLENYSKPYSKIVGNTVEKIVVEDKSAVELVKDQQIDLSTETPAEEASTPEESAKEELTETPAEETPETPAEETSTPEEETPETPAEETSTPEEETPETPAEETSTPESEEQDNTAEEPSKTNTKPEKTAKQKRREKKQQSSKDK